MNRRNIDFTDYSNIITKALKKGIFLTTKNGEKVNSMMIGWGCIHSERSTPGQLSCCREIDTRKLYCVMRHQVQNRYTLLIFLEGPG